MRSPPTTSGLLGQPGDINDLGGVAFSLRHVDQNIKTAYSHFWSFSIQRQLAKRTWLSLDYTGSKGVDLYSLGNVNTRGLTKIYASELGLDQATAPSTGNASRLNPTYGADNMRTNNGKSLYHAVTFGIDGHDLGGSGLSITGRYTWAKAKDNLSSTFSEGINANNLGFLDPFVGGVGGGPDLDYGYAEFDIRHRGAVSVIWELPIAKGSTGADQGAPERVAGRRDLHRPQRVPLLALRLLATRRFNGQRLPAHARRSRRSP